ncbi:MAG: transglycosylase SLT domain-containing protein, partial [Chloroflexi bacterium]|nr:transglycosylase SLT domain-containing protein [Chloroflexota bacterium]
PRAFTSLFATALPSPTASPTATLTPSPTATVSPTPTPSPTPLPVVRVQEADHALFNGDWNQAIALYQTALDQQAGFANDIAAAARFGLATAHLRAGNLDASAEQFKLFVQAYPTDPRMPEAYFQLGAIAQAQGTWGVAIENYHQYLTLKPGVIDSYVWERIARSYRQWGDLGGAVDAYTNAILADRSGGLTDLVEQKADALSAQGDLAGALALYDLVARSTDSTLTLARMDILRGRLQLQLGHTAEAYAHFQHAVDTYPSTYDAYQSLVALLDGGVQVDDLQRGIVDYYADEYVAALAPFDRDRANTQTPDPRVYYFAALTHRARGSTASAIKIYALDVSGGPAEALALAEQAAPANPAVPDALLQAGRIAERGNLLARAASIWAGINTAYPATLQAADGAFLAGITFYRSGQYESAAAQFQIAAGHPTAGAERKAAAWLWLAKTQNLRGDTASANAAYDAAQAADPGGYYSLRAAELRRNLLPFPPTQGYDFSFDVPAEKAAAEQWLADKLGIANTGRLGDLSPALAADGRWVRGRELWLLGLTPEAKTEFDALRAAYSSDALALYQYSLAFRALGAYATAIRAARAGLDALGLTDSFSAPPFFTHLRFGPYYADLITQAAGDYKIDPLLLYALVRQESLFEGSVTSSAAAQGLMQIIPDTGDWIADRLRWPNYQQSDLYRPFINVEFGAFYLDYQRQYLGGDMLAALAAYNAGPGNAEKWLSVSENDPDLFVEIIRLDEPRRYVRGVYEFYEIYRNLYGK